MRTTLALAAVAAAIMGAAPGARATEPFAKVGVSSPVFTFTRVARNEGMGATGVADPSRAANAVYNPANIVGQDGLSAFYQHDSFLSLVTVHDVGVSFARTTSDRSFHYGLGVRHVRQNYEYEFPRIVFIPGGTTDGWDETDYYTAITLGGGVNRDNVRVALGFAANVFSLDLVDDTASGWSFDFGARLDWRLKGMRDDVVYLHVGISTMGFEYNLDDGGYQVDIPDAVRLGIGVDYTTAQTATSLLSRRPAPVVSLAVNVDYVSHDRAFDEDDGLGVGVEFGLVEFLYLRAGSVDAMPAHSDGGTWGVGIAGGFGNATVRVDVAGYSLDNVLLESDYDIIYGVVIDYGL